jgi:acyl carrier protein
VYDDDRPLGVVGLCLIDQLDKTATLWYVLGNKSYAGQGVMTTAVNLFLEKAFTDLKLHSVQALVAEENSASRRVLEKNNFKRSGMQREAHARGDHFQNRICFDLLFSEYQKIPRETEAKKIHEIISRIKQGGPVADPPNLLTSGFLDSFDIIRLVDELEKTFNMKIEGREITEENFQSIEAIARLVGKTTKE